MRWLLSLTLMFCGSCCAESGAVVVSTLPADIASVIFEGRDADMPVGTAHEIALLPKQNEAGETSVPKSVADALRQMAEILPRWYLNALARSYGDNECSVIVNGTSYTTTVGNWLWVKWEMDDGNSALRRQLKSLGLHSRETILQAFGSGFCEFVRNGERAGIEEVAKYSVLDNEDS